MNDRARPTDRRALGRYKVQHVVSKAVKVAMRSRSHLEIGYKVWSDQECWFWLVTGPYGNGGTVGAAATEAEAIRDARTLIEDLSG